MVGDRVSVGVWPAQPLRGVIVDEDPQSVRGDWASGPATPTRPLPTLTDGSSVGSISGSGVERGRGRGERPVRTILRPAG
jgi:hypothetical protein